MSLTTEDLGKIKQVVNEVVITLIDSSDERLGRKIDKAVDDLAISAQKQFMAIDGRFDDIDSRLDGMDIRLGDMEEDLTVVKDMVKDHSFRMTKLEHQRP